MRQTTVLPEGLKQADKPVCYQSNDKSKTPIYYRWGSVLELHDREIGKG